MLHQRPFTIKRVKPTRNWHCVNVPAIILEDHAAQVLQTNTRQDSCWRLDRIGFPAIVRHLQLDHIRILFHPISSYLILFHPISSYFILFHPISSYFILFPRCFTMFHHLFRGTRLFEASLVERETEREGSLAAAGFCCQNSPSNPGRARHCIMSLPHFLKNDLNIFEHCVDNRIDIP
jgi:hypothetical protein